MSVGSVRAWGSNTSHHDGTFWHERVGLDPNNRLPDVLVEVRECLGGPAWQVAAVIGPAEREGHAPTLGLATELIEGVHTPTRPELLTIPEMLYISRNCL